MFNDLLWYSKQGQSNQTGAAQPNGPSWSQANERIRVMKDQLIAAKAYLNSAPTKQQLRLRKRPETADKRVRTRSW